MKSRLVITLVLPVILVIAGCSNQFLVSYEGARYPAVVEAKAIASRPSGVGLIGSSTFVSAGSFGAPEALKAAEEVGADFVQWSRGLDAGDGPAGAGVVQASLSPTGPVSSWAPAQPGQFLYRYIARYYRTGAPDWAGSAVSVGAPTEAEQVKDDDQAATQELPREQPQR